MLPTRSRRSVARIRNHPPGLPAVENSLALMLTQVNLGRCTLEQVVHWMCEAPARVWDVLNKGAIVRGFDADLVLVDLHKQAEVRDDEQETKCRWSPWHGTTLTGWPVRTWVLGRGGVLRGPIRAESRLGREVLFDHALGGYWGRTNDWLSFRSRKVPCVWLPTLCRL